MHGAVSAWCPNFILPLLAISHIMHMFWLSVCTSVCDISQTVHRNFTKFTPCLLVETKVNWLHFEVRRSKVKYTAKFYGEGVLIAVKSRLVLIFHLFLCPLTSCVLIVDWYRRIWYITAIVQLPNRLYKPPAKRSTKNWFLYGTDRVSYESMRVAVISHTRNDVLTQPRFAIK